MRSSAVHAAARSSNVTKESMSSIIGPSRGAIAVLVSVFTLNCAAVTTTVLTVYKPALHAHFGGTDPAPAQSVPIAIQFESMPIRSTSNEALGYEVPDSEVLVTGDAKAPSTMVYTTSSHSLVANAVLAGVAIGLHEELAKRITPKETRPLEDSLHLRFEDDVRAAVEAQIADKGLFASKFTLAPSDGPRLSLSPSVIIAIVGRNKAQLHAALRARLANPDGTLAWEATYFAPTGAERPLRGSDGWGDRDCAPLKASAAAALARLVKLMLTDVATPYPRHDARATLVQTTLPFASSPWQMIGSTLAEDDDTLTFLPSNREDHHFSGIYLLDKHLILALAPVAGDRNMALPKGAHLAVRRDGAIPVASTPGATAAAAATERPARVAPVQAAMPVPAPVSPQAMSRPPQVQHLDAAMVVGKTWRYAHPRDPARFGDVRLAFFSDHVDASNAKSSTSGSWQVRDDKLCVDLAGGWGHICYYVVEGAGDDGNDVALMLAASGRKLPLQIE